jgi:RimJ/RimL family protein N-acetyltransferase
METARLKFRPYEPEDLEFFVSLCRDPDVMRYIGNGKLKSRREIETWFSQVMARSRTGFGPWPILLKETGELIGHAGLVKQEVDGCEEWEIGYWLAKRHWGNGYATEAAAAFRDLALDTLKLNRVICIIQPENVPSIHVAAKIGMKKEKETTFRGIPVVIYALEKQDLEEES